MNFTAKTEYACLAMLELAQRFETQQPIQGRVLADSHGIPSQFLVQILQDLKRAGLVTSTRGASGGYRLTHQPQEVTLAEVLIAVEGRAEPTTCASAASPLAPVLLDVCHELSEARYKQLEAITLSELVARATVEVGPMWYI